MATLADAYALAPHLRPADVAELSAWGSTPEASLVRGVRASMGCMALELGGQLACLWGVSVAVGWLGASALGGPVRCGWLLGSSLIERHPRAFWRASKWAARLALQTWGPLSNAVDERNTVSIRWLSRLGADWRQTLSVNGHPFRVFVLGAKHV